MQMSGIKRLFTSSKYLLAGIACVGVIVMNVMGRIDGPRALEAILWIVGVALGATAIEDAAKKLKAGPVSDATLESLTDKLVPVATQLLQMLTGKRERVYVPPPPLTHCQYLIQEDDTIEELRTVLDELTIAPPIAERIRSEWKPGNLITLPMAMCGYYATKRAPEN